jgi:hypothetical protein
MSGVLQRNSWRFSSKGTVDEGREAAVFARKIRAQKER